MSEREQIEQTIAALEAQRSILGSLVVETAQAPLREKLATLQAAAPPAEADSERRQLLTVLFADVSGFTALSEKLDAEEVQDLLSRLWPHLDQAILRNDGQIDKHIGDAVMAVWGLAQAVEQDPIQAVRAALEMQTELAAFRAEQQIALAMRVGINTGLASISHVVSTGERNVIGDAVNLASRLEHAAPVNGVLISQETYDRIHGLFDVEPQPPLTVKGKAEPVHTVVVLREKPRAFHMQTRGLAGVTTRTIGRDGELSILQTAYQRAFEGAGLQWVTVSGEAGIGKSRLLYEFEKWIELRPEDIWYFKARAWPQTEHTPYYLLRNLLSSRFQITDGDELAIARDKLTTGLAEVLGPQLGEEAAAFIGQLVGLDFRHSRWIVHIAEDTRQIRGRAAVLFRAYLAQLCADHPTVLLLEDLHWADGESLTLLADLFAEQHAWRLCVIGLARPALWERSVLWGQTDLTHPIAYHTRLDLTPLSDKSANDLARELLQRLPTPPDWLVALLVERGTGNPYFIEELVNWLIEQGVIETDTREPTRLWHVNSERLVGLSVPGTVQGVLQARLECLEPTERATLQWASVVGRAFWNGAVEYIGQCQIPGACWEALRRRDLVFHKPSSQLPGQEEFLFKHALLRDVSYEYTLKKLRRVLHKRSAEWLRQATAERVQEWAAVIATHYERADEKALAAEWYAEAGKQAQATFALDAAIGYYQQALTFLPPQNDRDLHRAVWQADLYRRLGEVLRGQARFAEATQAFETMLAVTSASGDRVAQAQAWIWLSRVHQVQGDYHAALDSAQEAEKTARELGAEVLLANALYEKGFALVRLGDVKTSLALSEQALALSVNLNVEDTLGDILNLLGGIHGMQGSYEQARHYYERALALFQKLGDRNGVRTMLNNLGEVARARGDYQAATVLYQDALTLSREIGDRLGEILSLNNLGGAQVGLGEYSAAEAVLRRVIQMADVSHGWFALSETYCFLTEACLAQGQIAEAVETARRALELGQEREASEYIGTAWRALGLVAARLTEPILVGTEQYDAVACFTESARVFAETGMEGERARTLQAWAKYAAQRGEQDQSERLQREARAIFERLGMTEEVHRSEMK